MVVNAQMKIDRHRPKHDRAGAVVRRSRLVTLLACCTLLAAMSSSAAAAPHYELAYAEGQTVTISVKDPHPGKVARQAQGDYYEVIYPNDWENLTASVPQCMPCDHLGDGDDAFDYHDHVFGAVPKNNHGAYSALWNLTLVVPAYTGDAAHDQAVSEAYADLLPVTSAAAVQALLATTVNGSPVAERIDTDYHFLAAIVNANAAH